MNDKDSCDQEEQFICDLTGRNRYFDDAMLYMYFLRDRRLLE